MTIAQAINQGIQVARVNMGDLLRPATLRHVTGSSYVGGIKTPTYSDHAVDGVYDKFSFQEMSSDDFVQTDVKFVMFNPNNDLNPKTDDAFVLDGVTYAIRKADPTHVGGFKVTFTLVLRK